MSDEQLTVPLTAATAAGSAGATRSRVHEVGGVALFLALWLPMDMRELRVRQRETLEWDASIRRWMNGVERFAASGEKVDAFVFSGAPASFQRWGVEGTLKYFYERSDLLVKWSGDPDVAQATAGKRVAWLDWDGSRLEVRVKQE